LIIGLVVGGVALAGVCCCGVPLGWYFISNAMSKATKENYDKIQLGMTQSQVEEILGSGKTTNSLAVALFFAGVSGPNSASQIDHWSKAADQGRVYVWTKSDTTILVSYSSATGGKVNGKVILQSSGGARTVQEQWSNK
ncbi:MAG TPA: outer membrane protein assembly factor BamE, partial [Gemmataceae bacterium]|nr:outer membrane protein assembly factor BamE [Gemmataceae bacterium]